MSILNTVKKSLGFDPDYKAFDVDIIMHINSVFSTLTQLGVGPIDGFVIADDFDRWTSFLGETKKLEFVKTYTYLKVRLLFDPPSTSFALDAIKELVSEYEWRINVAVDTTPVPVPEEVIFDE